MTVDMSRDCEVVIEAAGTTSGFDDAVRRCRRGGTLVLASTTWEPIAISVEWPAGTCRVVVARR